MKKLMIPLLKFLLMVSIFSPSAQAQVSGQSSAMSGFRKNFATVMFCGLGGAVLGLSTLSFYGKPDEHIGNISTGFALGIMGGVVFATADTVQSIKHVESYTLHDGVHRNSNSPLLARVTRSDTIMMPVIYTDF